MKGGHHLKYFLTLVIMQNKKNVKHCMHSYYFYFLSINLKKNIFLPMKRPRRCREHAKVTCGDITRIL